MGIAFSFSTICLTCGAAISAMLFASAVKNYM